MLNLASLRYRNVLAEHGGPVEQLTCGETTVLGARWFEAHAYLTPENAPSRFERHVWGAADGSGTAASPLVARFKAVSEAIERWAHHALHGQAEGRRYGFGIDPSSNGMAAFPGVFARQARAAALAEAAERFNLLNWWEGNLAAIPVASPWPGVDAAIIDSAAPGVTVILHRRSERGYHVYGHAAADDFAGACRKAAVELERHEAVMRYWALAHAGGSPSWPETLHPIEQRSLFFASEEGYALFRERIAAGRTHHEAQPRLVFDGEVAGPWQRYANVWRVVFAPPSRRFVSRDPHYFMW